MELRKVKKQLSAACQCAGVRLALNFYMHYEVASEAKAHFKKLEAFSAQYNEILKDCLEGNPSLEALSGLRSEIMREMETVTAYTDSFQAYEYVLNRLEERYLPHLTEAEERDSFDLDQAVMEIMSYVTERSEMAVVNERIQSVLSQLPVRLTKQKFFSIIEEGMSVYKDGPAEGLDDMLYILRSEALLYEPQEAREGYEELHRLLEELKGADYRQMTAASYRSLAETQERAGDLLLDLSGELMLLMDLVNDLYLILLTRPFAMMDAMEEQTIRGILGDVLKLFAENGDKDTEDAIADRLYMLEGKQEAYFEQWMMGGISEESRLRASGEEEKALAEVLRKAELLMSGSSFVELETENKALKGIASREVLKEALDTLFADMTSSWKGMPKVTVRAAMAKVLAILPFFFGSVEEFQAYVRSSLESCTDIFERQACLRMLHSVMEQE